MWASCPSGLIVRQIDKSERFCEMHVLLINGHEQRMHFRGKPMRRTMGLAAVVGSWRCLLAGVYGAWCVRRFASSWCLVGACGLLGAGVLAVVAFAWMRSGVGCPGGLGLAWPPGPVGGGSYVVRCLVLGPVPLPGAWCSFDERL